MFGKGSKRGKDAAQHQPGAEQQAFAQQQASGQQPTAQQQTSGQQPGMQQGAAKGAGQNFSKKELKKLKKAQKNSKLLPAFCNIVGTVLLIAVIGLCVPLTVPRLLGYEVFDVISGSMEPELPVGSVIYVKATDPSEIQEGEIIAFDDGNGVISHRVTTNRTSVGEFVTKGDANNIEDINPVPYDAVIGRVESHIPMMGAFMALYASTIGKVYLLLTAACGVMLNVLARRIRETRRVKARKATAQLMGLPEGVAAVAAVAVGPDGEPVPIADLIATTNAANQDSTKPENWQESVAAEAAAVQAQKQVREKRTKGALSVLRNALIVVLATVFLGSAGVVGYVMWQYNESDSTYNQAREDFTHYIPVDGEKPPIQIDFADLLAKNPDIIGWIYCEGTPINYPVLHGKDNDQYLYHDYLGNYNIDGSIFEDSDNRPGFVDSNSIVYGHHMNSGSMFASLVNWADQQYYEDHPIMWLLTPTQNYKIVLFSGHHLNAYSHMYDAIAEPCKKMDVVLARALLESDFKTDAYFKTTQNVVALAAAGDAGFDEMEAADQAVIQAAADAAAAEQDPAAAQIAADAAAQAVLAQQVDNSPRTIVGKESADGLKIESDAQYVMLSTCAYLFDNDRYVLHGILQPVQ